MCTSSFFYQAREPKVCPKSLLHKKVQFRARPDHLGRRSDSQTSERNGNATCPRQKPAERLPWAGKKNMLDFFTYDSAGGTSVTRVFVFFTHRPTVTQSFYLVFKYYFFCTLHNHASLPSPSPSYKHKSAALTPVDMPTIAPASAASGRAAAWTPPTTMIAATAPAARQSAGDSGVSQGDPGTCGDVVAVVPIMRRAPWTKVGAWGTANWEALRMWRVRYMHGTARASCWGKERRCGRGDEAIKTHEPLRFTGETGKKSAPF